MVLDKRNHPLDYVLPKRDGVHSKQAPLTFAKILKLDPTTQWAILDKPPNYGGRAVQFFLFAMYYQIWGKENDEEREEILSTLLSLLRLRRRDLVNKLALAEKEHEEVRFETYRSDFDKLVVAISPEHLMKA